MTAWRYEIAARRLTDPDGNVLIVGQGVNPPYSGNGVFRDDPSSAGVKDHGVLPPGRYAISGAYDDPHLGPCVMRLDPDGWDGGGRTALRIHGDNSRGDASASDGCLILPRWARQAVAASRVTTLVVEA